MLDFTDFRTFFNVLLSMTLIFYARTFVKGNPLLSYYGDRAMFSFDIPNTTWWRLFKRIKLK